MKLRMVVAAFLLGLVLLTVCMLAAAVKAQEETGDEQERPAPQFKRVGVYEFDHITKRKDAGAEFSQVLCERLAAKYGDVEFVFITPDDAGYPEGPVLLKHAQRLGEKYEVEAIIDGRFLGYKITGGSWPNRAVTFPEVALQVMVRVVETAEGTVFGDYSQLSKKPRVFSQRIRTEKELWEQAIRAVIDEIAAQMEEDGLFYQEEQEAG